MENHLLFFFYTCAIITDLIYTRLFVHIPCTLTTKLWFCLHLITHCKVTISKCDTFSGVARQNYVHVFPFVWKGKWMIWNEYQNSIFRTTFFSYTRRRHISENVTKYRLCSNVRNIAKETLFCFCYISM